MSLSAIVWDVSREAGELKLWLGERNVRHPDPAGQASLLVVGSCSSAELLVGAEIWAPGSGPIMCGDVVIGHRIGYAHCTLLNHAIREAVGLPATSGVEP